MDIRHDIQDNWLDNPIAWREFITLFRQRGKWFWRIVYALSALVVFTPFSFTGHGILATRLFLPLISFYWQIFLSIP